ncbi:hypothetical protein ECG_00470 [Echinococcus granulosus]|uniref:Expressed conserved protein n=1 Tax=Echinococcus granulosus TaxID=6210 RepID=A0A068WG99_ECHGR|nr:hypothetical protein ECG_00470 [Echinococcus granulosus]CDS16684.1 expressed conserved protein [Echinococcus granulosus]
MPGHDTCLSFDSNADNFKCKLRLTKSENSRLKAELASIAKTHQEDLAREKNETDMIRDKYERLLESHNQLLKLNSELEERLLVAVETLQKERAKLNSQLSILGEKLAESEETIKRLTTACDSYKNDCKVATELLHADPSRFLPINSDRHFSLPSKHRDKSSTSSEEALLAAPTHYLLPTTFPPIALYSTGQPVFPQPPADTPPSHSTDSKPSPPSESLILEI